MHNCVAARLPPTVQTCCTPDERCKHRVQPVFGAGFVTRTRDPADERRVLVDLTPRSRALEAEVRGITDKIKSACQLTDQGVDDLRRTLEALAHPASK